MEKSGFRCTLCTGCGRCPGIDRQLHIVTERMAQAYPDLRNQDRLRLVVVDIGTTTIAMQLHGEDGSVADSYVALNPQAEFGADVLSRIAAAERVQNAIRMQEQVRTVLEKGIARFRKLLAAEEKMLMVLAANTTMVYLLMGRNPKELGQAPFHATHLAAVKTEMAGVSCFILPGLSAFVGGDIVAGIHACGMMEREELTLLIDLGTNGEMVLGNCRKIYACATATGPAFEGGVNRGVWGADMVHFLAEMRKAQLLDEDGLITEKYFDTGVRIGDVCVTQEAVRAIQLAKAAIRAGITILAEQYGCTPQEIDRVILAGGFGYYLQPEDAATIGLIPKELVNKTVSGGNTALAGALEIGARLIKGGVLGTQSAISKLSLKENVMLHILNLAEVPDFENYYLQAFKF